MPTKHLLIKGKVQGVFYRAAAREKAEELGVNGWIKNSSAGEVEAVVSGETENLQAFISWCFQGPSKAVVAHIERTELEEKIFSGFQIVRENF